MTYTVRYKRGLLWRRIKDVVADGLIENYPIRFFITLDEERIEIPSEGTIFRFSPERFKATELNSEKEGNANR